MLAAVSYAKGEGECGGGSNGDAGVDAEGCRINLAGLDNESHRGDIGKGGSCESDSSDGARAWR